VVVEIPMRAVFLLLLIFLLTPSPVLAQPDGQAPPLTPSALSAAVETAAADGDIDEATLERVRRELARPDTLRRVVGDDGRVVFRVEVEGQLPRFSEFIGKDQPLVGTSPWGAMTHGDFLSMVTPPQAQPYGAFTGGDLLQVLATSLASAFAITGAVKAVEAVRGEVRERRSKAAEEEVQQVVAEVERRQAEEAARKAAEEEDAARKKAATAPPKQR
jgi:hypothetical protein